MVGKYVLLLAVVPAGLALGALAGCRDEPQEQPWEPPKRPIRTEEDQQQAPARAPFVYDPNVAYEAVVRTTQGDFRIGFYKDETPNAVRNFVLLAADWRIYDGAVFHRVVADDYVVTGDPEGYGLDGGSPLRAADLSGEDLMEFTDRPFVAGTVGLAARADNPGSAQSQWFVCLRRRPESDGRRAAFGYVKEGLDVVRKISQAEVEGDRAVHPTRRWRPVDPPRILEVEIVKVN